jgi:hypothetical protein
MFDSGVFPYDNGNMGAALILLMNENFYLVWLHIFSSNMQQDMHCSKTSRWKTSDLSLTRYGF